MDRPRRRISSDLFLIATSLLVACVIWMIAKGRDRGQDTISVAVRLRSPEHIVSRPLENRVSVTMGFPKSLESHIIASNFLIELPWENLPDPHGWAGVGQMVRSPLPVSIDLRRHIKISPNLSDNLALRLQRQLQYISVDPNQVAVEARFISRPAQIRFPTVGDLPDGYALEGSVSMQVPREIMLTAPPAVFAELGASADVDPVGVSAEPVNLEGRTESFSETVRLILPDQVECVRKDDQRVDVRVNIKQVQGERTISNVPITLEVLTTGLRAEFSPPAVALRIQAPSAILPNLEISDFRVLPATPVAENPDTSASVSLQAVANDPALREGIRILSITPEQANVTFRLLPLERREEVRVGE